MLPLSRRLAGGVFFIVSLFVRRCLPGADDSCPPVSLSETDHQEPLLRRVTDYQFASFVLRMIGVVEDARQRLCEPDAMLLDVLVFLRGIPLEFRPCHRMITGANVPGGPTWRRTHSRPIFV